MSTDMKRRIFLKRSLAASAVGIAASAGLLAPQQVMAEWPKAAFEAKDISAALNALLGSDKTEPSDLIKFDKPPEIAENSSVVPVKLDTSLEGVESITIIAEANPVPLVAHFKMGKRTLGHISTRIKMAKHKTNNETKVIAIVKAKGKLYSAHKATKITIGGCGG